MRTATVAIQGNLWTYFKTDTGHFIGICDALKLTIQSDSHSELIEDMHDVMEMIREAQ